MEELDSCKDNISLCEKKGTALCFVASFFGLFTSLAQFMGGKLLELFSIVSGLWHFSLIVLATIIFKKNRHNKVIVALVHREITKCGLATFPILTFVACVMGFVVVGQSAAMTTLLGSGGSGIVGTIIVIAVFKEIGPLVTVLVVLIRVGSGTVVDLATKRAIGDLDNLISQGIDPVQFYIIPRFIGMCITTYCLTIYLITFSLLTGYVAVFFMNIPWKPMEYLGIIINALSWADFISIFLKTVCFGGLVAIATCYESLANPVRLNHVPHTLIKAVIDCVIGWTILDVFFLLIFG